MFIKYMVYARVLYFLEIMFLVSFVFIGPIQSHERVYFSTLYSMCLYKLLQLLLQLLSDKQISYLCALLVA